MKKLELELVIGQGIYTLWCNWIKGVFFYTVSVCLCFMNEDGETGKPINTVDRNETTRVGTSNAGYKIVASVRMHSTAFKEDLNEDMTICLGVNHNGSMVSWKAWHTEERLNDGNIGWGSGSYQPNREGSHINDLEKNRAIDAFKDAIKCQMDSCIARTKTVSEDVIKASSKEL